VALLETKVATLEATATTLQDLLLTEKTGLNRQIDSLKETLQEEMKV
jgi:hypothetical protein